MKRSRPDPDEDEEDDRPRRRRSREREDEEEEDDRRERRPTRSVRRIEEDIAAPTIPMGCAIGSILFFCAPPVGYGLANIAYRRADEALDALPGGRRSRAARKQLERAKFLATIGGYVSLASAIIILVISLYNWIRG